MRALVLCALAACSYPEKVLIDAPGAPFGCINTPLPATADNPVTIGGTTTEPFTLTPIANTAVSAQLPGIQTPIFVAHSDATGAFHQRQATGGQPLDAYFVATSNGYATTYYYPSRPITHDIDYPIVLLTSSDAATLSGAFQITFDPGKAQALMTINDCNGTPVAGAVVTTTPAGTVRYFNGVQPSATATSTDNQGVVMVANLPPGNVIINATVGGMSFKALNVQSVAGTFIQTKIQP